MDIQLKKGIIEVCVLAALRKQDSYGYQIVKDVSSYIFLSESTLYPILKRLESMNFLVTYQVEHNSRLRKYYRITDLGVERLYEFLNEWQEILKVVKFIEASVKA